MVVVMILGCQHHHVLRLGGGGVNWYIEGIKMIGLPNRLLTRALKYKPSAGDMIIKKPVER